MAIQMLAAVSLLLCNIGQVAKPEQKKDKVGSKKLSTAIAEANGRLSRMSEVDKAAIESAGIFKGRFDAKCTVVSQEGEPGDDMTLRVVVSAPLNKVKQEDFKADDERRAMAAAFKNLKAAEGANERAAKIFTQQWQRKVTRGSKFLAGKKDGWYHKVTGQWISDAQYEQDLATATKEADDQLADAKNVVKDTCTPVIERTKSQKEQADKVEAVIQLSSELSKKMNWEKFTKSGGTFAVKVDSWEPGVIELPKPATINRIAKISLTAVDVENRLTKK